MDGNGDRAAWVRAALQGSLLAPAADREAAAGLDRLWPGTGDLIAQAHGFHRRAAAWGVRDKPGVPAARAVIFSACGLPPRDGPLHAQAAAEAPQALFGYCDPDAEATVVNRSLLALPDPGRVSARTADPADPAGVLGDVMAWREIRAGRPVQVHAVLVPQRWPGDLLRRVLAGYAQILPPGSSVALSAIQYADGGYLAACEAVTGARIWSHDPADVARTVAQAGLRLHPWGVRDAAQWGRPAPGGDRRPARAICAVCTAA